MTYTQHFLHQMSQVRSPECRVYRVPQTVHGILLEFSKYSQLGRSSQSRLAVVGRKPSSLTNELGPWPNALPQRRALMSFPISSKEHILRHAVRLSSCCEFCVCVCLKNEEDDVLCELALYVPHPCLPILKYYRIYSPRNAEKVCVVVLLRTSGVP